MKLDTRYLYPAFLLAALVMTGGCAAPSGKTEPTNPDPAHNTRNALDWAGAYRGVLPCADCPGIETIVILQGDGTYHTQYRYLERGERIFTAQGQFSWNAAGDTISLDGQPPEQYFVAEGRLIRLAADGSRIAGALAAHYVLGRLAGVTGKYWQLVELNGQPVPALKRAPYLILNNEAARVTGFSGCNAFSGGYELDEAALRIGFGQLAATMMACPHMQVESAFFEVLRSADNYSCSDDGLTLNRARMAPLARFKAVYLP